MRHTDAWPIVSVVRGKLFEAATRSTNQQRLICPGSVKPILYPGGALVFPAYSTAVVSIWEFDETRGESVAQTIPVICRFPGRLLFLAEYKS